MAYTARFSHPVSRRPLPSFHPRQSSRPVTCDTGLWSLMSAPYALLSCFYYNYTSSLLFTVTVHSSHSGSVGSHLFLFTHLQRRVCLWLFLRPPPPPRLPLAISPSTRLLLSHWLLFTVLTCLQVLLPTTGPKPYNRPHILQQTNVKKIMAKTRAVPVWIELSDNSMVGDIYRAIEMVWWPGRMTTRERRDWLRSGLRNLPLVLVPFLCGGHKFKIAKYFDYYYYYFNTVGIRWYYHKGIIKYSYSWLCFILDIYYSWSMFQFPVTFEH